MKPTFNKEANATRISTATLTASCVVLLLMPVHALSANLTMEDSMMHTMESAVSRTANTSGYETPVGFERNSQFNQTRSVQPGWMLNATAIGNLINVQVQGAGNTVVVNAVQINSGNQTSVIGLGPGGNASNSSRTPQTTPTPTPKNSTSGGYGQ